jgi:hypothetical protein
MFKNGKSELNLLNKKFIGIINDGDLRRGFLKGFNLNSSIKRIINTNPFFVKTILDLNSLSSKKLNDLCHVPIIKNNKIYGLYIQNVNINIIISLFALIINKTEAGEKKNKK